MPKYIFSRWIVIGSFFFAPNFFVAKDLSKIPDVNPAGLPGSLNLPKATSFTEDMRRPNLVVFEGRKSKAEMEKAAEYLSFLSRRGYKANRPYYQVKLGQFLIDLNQDYGANQVLMDFLHEGTQPYNPDILEAPATYEALYQFALLSEMRILVRNQHQDEFAKFLQITEPQTGYEHLLLAEVLMLAGNANAVKIHLDSACANPTGHPETNWGRVYIPLHATLMAYSMGEPILARVMGEGIYKRGRDSEKWPQWSSAWRIVNELFELSEHSFPKIPELHDGTFQGVCSGFIDSIYVEITSCNGNLNQVQIVKGKEDRPYSALETIPTRIQSRQTLAVDCVTGATVTSSAVIIAAARAMLKAL